MTDYTSNYSKITFITGNVLNRVLYNTHTDTHTDTQFLFNLRPFFQSYSQLGYSRLGRSTKLLGIMTGLL